MASALVVAVPRLLLTGVFAPLALAVEFGVQADESFRVALLGRYDFRGDEDGGTGRVSHPSDHRDDQLYALWIGVVSVTLAAVVTAALVFLL